MGGWISGNCEWGGCPTRKLTLEVASIGEPAVRQGAYECFPTPSRFAASKPGRLNDRVAPDSLDPVLISTLDRHGYLVVAVGIFIVPDLHER